jgi:prevent-host-death family protein
MSKSYSVADARARLPKILDDVEAGKDVQLTRRGRPVAVVLSPLRYEMLCSEHTNFGDAYHAFLGRHAPEEIGLEPGFFSSLRDLNRQLLSRFTDDEEVILGIVDQRAAQVDR